MSKTNAFEQDILELIFNATTLANLADDTATSPATTLTVSLHTGSPGEAGDMTTSEATYTGYARQTVARTSGGWTVGASGVSPVSAITFPEATGGTETITHIGIGTGVSDNLLYYGTITPNISVATGVVPSITTDSVIAED